MKDTMLSSYNDFGRAVDAAAAGMADSITGALTDSVSEAVSDPLVLAIMSADRVDPSAFEAMLRRMAAKLAAGKLGGGRLCTC